MPEVRYGAEEIYELEALAIKARSDHLKSAQSYLEMLFQKFGAEPTYLGAYSLLLRGRQRSGVVAIHIHLNRDKKTWKECMTLGQDRIIRSVSDAGSHAYVIFVRTSGGWDEIEGKEQIVEVTLMPKEALPANKIHSEWIQPKWEKFLVATIPSTFKHMMKAFNKHETTDDFVDIGWLIDKYPRLVSAARHNVEYARRERFIEAIDQEITAGRMEGKLLTRYKQALGIIWPPVDEYEGR